MKAAMRLAPRRMEIVDEPEPVPGPDQALVRIEACGICGSDLHLYLGDHPYSTFPRTPGHELSGTVVALGDRYEGPIEIGDRVAIEPLIPCGHCYACRRGRTNCCANLQVLGAHANGGMSELFAVDTRSLYPTGDLDPELTAMVEPISIGVWAALRGEVTAEDLVVIFGAGPIGQAIVLAAVDRGARVLVVDKVTPRLELARKVGAEVVVEAGRDDTARAVSDWTGGEGASVVFDATGVPAVIRQAADLVASSGRIVIVGISDQEVSIPVIEFTRKELSVLGSRNSAGIFADAVALVQRNQEKVRSLITHRFPLDQAPQALEFALEHPTEAEKVMITVGGQG
jgi:threonine dehydrogenase-like Zn-dependent dehydrogenase